MTVPSNASDGPTIRDIAREAGVSTATVSRALKNQPGLSETTRTRLVELARQMGYDVNKLHPIKARRIGLFLHVQHFGVLPNPFYFPVIHGAEQACSAAGMALSYSSVSGAETVEELVKLHEVDGLLCAGHMDQATLHAFGRTGKPVVLLDHQHPAFPSVNNDNFQGAYQITRHLMQMGRGRVAYLGGPRHHSVIQRQHGYLQALMDGGVGVDVDLIVQRSFSNGLPEVQGLLQGLLRLPEPPDAIFTHNDEAALLLLEACKRLGIRVPEDLLVAGFDDLALAAHSVPSLTSVHVDKELLGKEGVRLLLNPRWQDEQVVLPVHLVVRQSSTPAQPD